MSVDDTEQYSRRTNLRIQGIAESGTGDDARAKVLEIFNQKMKMSPPLSDQDIERCHRLGRQTDPARPRCMIITLKSERMRDSAYSARGFLKNRNKSAEPALRLYINGDLTLRRSFMAFQTRKLRAEKRLQTAGLTMDTMLSRKTTTSLRGSTPAILKQLLTVSHLLRYTDNQRYTCIVLVCDTMTPHQLLPPMFALYYLYHIIF